MLGSTGLGGGVAIPHACFAELKQPFGMLARLRKGAIAFDAIDGQPVNIVFLLLLPADPDPEHLHALASVARAMRDSKIARTLRGARDGAQAYQCLVGAQSLAPK